MGMGDNIQEGKMTTQPAQLDMFVPTLETPIPASRATDPETSRIAEQRVDIAGQRKIVLETLRAHPMSTGFEIDHWAGLPESTSHRRLPELEKLHQVRRLRKADGSYKTALCMYHKTPCCLWEAI